MLDGNLAIIH